MTLLKIANGSIIDPANSIDQVIGDIWISEGKIVAPTMMDSVTPDRVIDATRMIVMPGGIDMHCHVAGPKVNTARKMFPRHGDQSNSVIGEGALMTTTQTGLRYAGLGYTTLFDAAVPASMARHAHLELQDTPAVDSGLFVMVGNNHFIFECIRRNRHQELREFLAWMLNATLAYAPKLVNPGGVEKWKLDGSNALGGIDVAVDHDGLTPRTIIESIARAANDLQLPHPVHLHCNDLGRPGNWRTTLESMKVLNGLRAHLTHIQFHSFGDGDDDNGSFGSAVAPLVDYVNQQPNLSVDVGQVMFGKTVSLTGDGALGEYLYRINGRNWYCHDVELEAGCGISPLVYKYRNSVNALQWMIGLEWFLTIDNLWQVALSTDHPNGGSFLAYPQLIAYLMSADLRREALAKMNPRALRRSNLPDIDREFSLFEIALITRAAPARILGLQNKGHLAVGADADVTIYDANTDREKMFRFPSYVVKAGELIIEAGQLCPDACYNVSQSPIKVTPAYDRDILPTVDHWLEKYGTVTRAAIEI